jgi:hypothetical protein
MSDEESEQQGDASCGSDGILEQPTVRMLTTFMAGNTLSSLCRLFFSFDAESISRTLSPPSTTIHRRKPKLRRRRRM